MVVLVERVPDCLCMEISYETIEGLIRVEGHAISLSEGETGALKIHLMKEKVTPTS